MCGANILNLGIKELRALLRDPVMIILIAWSFTGIYPMKWEIDAFNSTKNDVAIETISLRYNTVERTK